MANVIIVGAQWGDEGKAKIVDRLAEQADVVIRCQGGCNAGHTVVHQGEVFKFHLIPSGLLYPDKLCIVGSGTVIAPEVILREIAEIEAKGYSTTNLKISDRAHLTLPYHVTLDRIQEENRSKEQKGEKIGTTGKGIGPTYMDKAARIGLRLGDIFESDEYLKNRIAHILSVKGPLFEHAYQTQIESVDELFALCQKYAKELRSYVTNTIPLIHEAMVSGKNILFEGAQGTLLDIDYGTYPFVTSSNSTAGGACTGSGIGPSQIDQSIGVMKAYTTRVGSGPFPTELEDEVGSHLQEVGKEFGTTTGRRRRCGWFDGVIAKYSVQVNGLDGVALTKLDVLDGLKELRLCVAYRDKETGKETTDFPSQLTELDRLEPVYETFPGWEGSVSLIRSYDELPVEARHYLERIAQLIGAPMAIVSVGPERNETIMVFDPMKGSSKKGSSKKGASNQSSKDRKADTVPAPVSL